MRALSELYAGPEPAPEPGPVEPLAVLSVVVRGEPEFDAGAVFDRALFGLEPDAVQALGPVVPHLLEVAYEALERAAFPFDTLRSTRFATWVGSSGAAPWAATDGASVARVLGVPGPAAVVIEPGAGALLALHTAAQGIRAGECEVALVVGEAGPGVGAVVLGRIERAAERGWRVRGLLLGSGVARIGAERAALAIAGARAGIEEGRPAAAEGAGLAGLAAAIAALEGVGDHRELAVEETGQTLTVGAIVGAAEQTAMGDQAPRILGLSARTSPALFALGRLAVARLGTDSDLVAIAADAAARPTFEHRVAVPLTGVEQVRARLSAWLDGGSGGPPGSPEFGRAQDGGIAFVVPPAGVQFAGMADGLWSDPVFRAALERCDRAVRAVLHRSLLSVMYPAPGREAQVDDPGWANPLTFALAYGLAELLASRGVVPAAVLGCGVGELVAATIAGSCDLEGAIALAAERGRLLRTLDVEAARAILLAPEGTVSDLLANIDDVDVVSVPVPDRVVIGGSRAAVAAAIDQARAAGVLVEVVAGSPVHPPLVDPICAELEAAARGLVFAPTGIAVVSSATGRRLDTAEPAHWVATLRAPIRLAAAVDATFALGCRTFVELGARPTVVQAGEALLAGQVRWYSVLQPGVPDREALEEVLAGLWVRGAPVVRGPYARGPGGAELPTYPWDRRPLDAELTEDFTGSGPAPRPASWRPLPELAAQPEDTLVPADEMLRGSDADDARDLVDLGRAPIRPTPGSQPGIQPIQTAVPASDEAPDLAPDGLTYDELRPLPGPAEPEPPADPTAGLLDPAPSEPTPEPDPRVVWSEAWVEAPVPADDEASVEGTTFVILADREGLGDYLATLLEQRGGRIVRVLAEAPYPRDDGTLFVWDPLAEGSWAHLVDALGSLEGRPCVVDLWSLDAAEEGAIESATGWPAVVGLVQALAACGVEARLHLVTRGAVRTPDPAGAVTGGGLWGIAALLRGEAPDWLGGIVDLDPDDEDADALLAHLVGAIRDEDAGAFAFRDGRRWRRQLEGSEQIPEPGAVDASGTWVLAGDVDAALLELGAWLGAAGVRKLVVVSAGPPPGDVLRGVLDLQRKGIACVVVRADAADPKDADAVRQRLGKEASLAGVVFRSAARPVPLLELPIAEGIAQWRRAVAMLDLLLSIAPAAQVWAWCEGQVLNGAAGAGIAAPIAGSIAARLQARGERFTVVHAAPASAFPAGLAVRLVAGLGPAGGVRGAWRS